jgi:hypothetical protein
LIQVRDEHAGQKVRCSKCKTVVTAPAATTPAAAPPKPAAPAATLAQPAAATPPVSTSPKPANTSAPPQTTTPAAAATPAPPLPPNFFSPETVASDFATADEDLPSVLPVSAEEAALAEDAAIPARPGTTTPRAASEPLFPETKKSQRSRDEEAEVQPRRRRPPEKSSALPMIALLVGGGTMLLFVLAAGIALTVYYLSAVQPVASTKEPGNPVFNPPPPVNPPVNPPIVNPVPNPPDPMQNNNPPFVAEAPINAVLDRGRFETQVNFDANAANPQNQQISKRYQFDTKADTVYWVQVKDNPQVRLKVSGPEGPVTPQPDRFGQQPQGELAFVVKQGGNYTALLECARFDAKPCKFTIREMDGTEPLPNRLKIKSADVDLPRLEPVQTLDVYDKQFSGAAFAPDGKHFYMAHGDNTLSYWEQPGSVKKGSYKMPDRLFALGVDGQGRLYAQASKGKGGPISTTQRGAGDISVWENLRPEQDDVPLPAPSKTISLGGVVQRFINSPDGKWLYYLDSHNRKLGRIDTATASIDQQIDKLSPGTKSFCMTADGKKIYCCSEHNRIDIIDTEPFQLSKTVRLNKGQPTDIAASNAGLLFLVGKNVGDQPFARSNCMLVDLTKDIPEEANILPLTVGHHCQFVVLLPDQRAALFSGDRRVTVCSLPSRPALFQAATHEQQIRDYFMPGQLVVSPDSRTLLQDTGVVLSISR